MLKALLSSEANFDTYYISIDSIGYELSLITASAFFGSFSFIVSNLWFLSITLFSHTYVHFMLTIYTFYNYLELLLE